MAQNNLFQRLLEAGMQFTQLTQKRAEGLVREFVRTGEVQAEQAQAAVAELVERSRKNTEKLVETIQNEVRRQMATFEVASREAYTRLEQQLRELRGQLPGARPAERVADVTAPVEKAAAKQTAAKKTPAKKTTAKKTTAKKAAAKKRATTKTAAKKTAAS